MALARTYLAKRMQLSGPGLSKHLIPRIRSECHNTRERRLYATEIDCAINPWEIATQRAHGRVALAVRLDTNHQENRGTREGCKHRLRHHCRLFPFTQDHSNSSYIWSCS